MDWILIVGAVIVAVIVYLARQAQQAANIPPVPTTSDLITRVSQGIAVAEGFQTPDGTVIKENRAARNHNPGDLTQDLTGKAVGMDNIFVVYANDADGFEALAVQVNNFFTGSKHYGPNQTIRETAAIYTKTNPNVWALTVSDYLGVSPDTKWSELT